MVILLQVHLLYIFFFHKSEKAVKIKFMIEFRSYYFLAIIIFYVVTFFFKPKLLELTSK